MTATVASLWPAGGKSQQLTLAEQAQGSCRTATEHLLKNTGRRQLGRRHSMVFQENLAHAQAVDVVVDELKELEHHAQSASVQ